MNFNDEAKEWDTDRRINRAKQIADFLKSKINFGNKSIMLEFGCGTGLISNHFLDYFSKIIGYDQSDKMLEVFNKKFLEEKDRVIGINNIVELNSEVDIVISSMVFHHIEDINQSLNDIKKVLKKHGELIIVDLDLDDGSFHSNEIGFKGHNGFDRDLFVKQLSLNGFNTIQVGTVPQDKKILSNKEISYSLFYVHAIKID